VQVPWRCPQSETRPRDRCESGCTSHLHLPNSGDKLRGSDVLRPGQLHPLARHPPRSRPLASPSVSRSEA
jgi:hypothetical protein